MKKQYGEEHGMENREKKHIANALNDEMLDGVSGGTSNCILEQTGTDVVAASGVTINQIVIAEGSPRVAEQGIDTDLDVCIQELRRKNLG